MRHTQLHQREETMPAGQNFRFVTVPLDQAQGVFFFQAEDGIRDGTVTGVQTCALPIWLNGVFASEGVWADAHHEEVAQAQAEATGVDIEEIGERRVGKECRSRWSP